jgi:hypothetical protein
LHFLQNRLNPAIAFRQFVLVLFPFQWKILYRFSPECPKAGSISCANEAAATIAKIIHMKPCTSFKYGYFSIIFFPTKRPKERPTTETSKLCVKRVCTKSILESGITCVLSWRLLKPPKK